MAGRDVNAFHNVLQPSIKLTGRDMKLSVSSGMSETIAKKYVAALAGQDIEQYTGVLVTYDNSQKLYLNQLLQEACYPIFCTDFDKNSAPSGF